MMSNRKSVFVWALIAGLTPAHAYDRKQVAPMVMPNFNQPDLSANNNTYTLTPEELKYDCKRLTGRTQIRIRQLRSTTADKPTSEVARGLQQAATPFVGGTNRGIDPQGDNARDLAAIKAYNAQLAAKGCQTFNVDAELAPGAANAPRPVPKPKPAAAAAPSKAPAAAAPPLPAAKAP
jgi:hypothetical protein